MLYISIPVHEQLPVIINQCKNMLKFTDVQIILHCSSRATFSKFELTEALRRQGLAEKVLINPCSMPTWWGSILHAHLANVNYVRQISDNPDKSIVIFHASNDLMVRDGASSYVLNNKNIYHTRLYVEPGYYWPVAHAFKDDKLTKLRQCLNFRRGIVAGQIEGSCYPLPLLLEISRIIEDSDVLHNEKIWYPREEVLLPTIACAIGEKPKADPYVYSELHRIDHWSWRAWKLIDSIYPLPRGREFLKRQIHRLIVDSKIMSISIKDVEQIINNKISICGFYDGANYWKPYSDPKNIFAVKRVIRDMNNPVRKYISRL